MLLSSLLLSIEYLPLIHHWGPCANYNYTAPLDSSPPPSAEHQHKTPFMQHPLFSLWGFTASSHSLRPTVKSFIFFCPASFFNFCCLSWWYYQSKLKTFIFNPSQFFIITPLGYQVVNSTSPLRSILISWSHFHFPFTALIHTHILPPLNLWVSLSMGALAFRFPSILLSAVILTHSHLTLLIFFELLSTQNSNLAVQNIVPCPGPWLPFQF